MTTTDLAATDLVAAQRVAIDESGWGLPYRFFQPRNLAFWLYVWLLVLGTASLLSQLNNLFAGYESEIVLGYIAFAIYTIPFWVALNYIDRFDAVPNKVRVLAFAWGGLIATWVMALNANLAVFGIYGKVFGQAFLKDWGPGLTAPFTEEIAKGLGVAIIIVLAPKVVRSAFDGFIIGGFVGLGFQVFENVSYVIEGAQGGFGANAQGESISMIITRASVGLTSHTVYSAIFGMGLVWFLGRPTEKPRRILGLLFMASAMLMHGLWDAMAAISGGSPVILPLFLLGVPLFAIVVFFLALKYSSEHTRHWMHDILAPEVARGTVTEAELDAVAGRHKDRRVFVKSNHGHKSHAQAKHVLAAATDLGEQLAASRGEDTPAVQFARSEVTRVRG